MSLIGFFANRDLDLRGSWKLAGASLLPRRAARGDRAGVLRARRAGPGAVDRGGSRAPRRRLDLRGHRPALPAPASAGGFDGKNPFAPPAAYGLNQRRPLQGWTGYFFSGDHREVGNQNFQLFAVDRHVDFAGAGADDFVDAPAVIQGPFCVKSNFAAIDRVGARCRGCEARKSRTLRTRCRPLGSSRTGCCRSRPLCRQRSVPERKDPRRSPPRLTNRDRIQSAARCRDCRTRTQLRRRGSAADC